MANDFHHLEKQEQKSFEQECFDTAWKKYGCDFYQKYYDKIKNSLVCGYKISIDDIDEIFHEVLLGIFLKPYLEIKNFYNYFYTSCVNNYKNKCLEKKKICSLPEDTKDEDEDELEFEVSRKNSLKEELRSLEKKGPVEFFEFKQHGKISHFLYLCRKDAISKNPVLEMRLNSLTFKEIVDFLNNDLNEGTVKSRCHRSRNKIKEKCTELGAIFMLSKTEALDIDPATILICKKISEDPTFFFKEHELQLSIEKCYEVPIDYPKIHKAFHNSLREFLAKRRKEAINVFLNSLDNEIKNTKKAFFDDN